MSNYYENVFNLSKDSINSGCVRLKLNGTIIIRIDEFSMNFETTIKTWHECVSRIFNLSEKEKKDLGLYRVEKGVHIGYREEEGREFFETHLTSDGHINPNPNIENYEMVVQSLFSQLYGVTKVILVQIATMLGLDPNFFVDLTDRGCVEDGELSSSLLRICKYPRRSSTDSVVFGAHTDTSILTVAPLASVPGLECWDPESCLWWCPESEAMRDADYDRSGFVIVMVGEMLQLLTGDTFRAAVHRVRSPCEGHDCRVSCPLLVRGRGKAEVGEAAEPLPQLFGVKMALLHGLLDRKRKKTAAENAEKENDEWVLSAWPVQCLGPVLPLPPSVG